MTISCLPASVVARPPRHRAPRLSCDCHFHVFGDSVAYPFSVPRDYTPPGASLEAWQEMAGILGLERMVIVQPSVYGTDNRCTLDALQAVGVERGRAVVVLGDGVSDADLERLNAAGVRGVRFNLVNAGGLTPDRVAAVARRVAPLGWHLQFYVDGTQLPELAPTIAKMPTPVVIDHMGQIRSSSPTYRKELNAMLTLMSNGKTWVKLCGYRASTESYSYCVTKSHLQKSDTWYY
ncbi:amidohydrolase family protein [Paraburkholderia sp. A2RI-6]|uniref:amidohydrolase family protein n=1 Tax=Paraburkholderia sp. A2RI-6 TaxID=3028371 RepID=UPI003B7B8D10